MMQRPYQGHDVVIIRNTVPAQGNGTSLFSSNCRVLSCYFFILFAVALIWITIIDTQQVTVIVFSAVFTSMFLISFIYYKYRQRHAANRTHADEEAPEEPRRVPGTYEPFDVRELAFLLQLRRNLEALNELSRQQQGMPATGPHQTNPASNGLTDEQIGRLPVVQFSEEKFLEDNTATTYTRGGLDIAITDGVGAGGGGAGAGEVFSAAPIYHHNTRECSVCLSQYNKNDLILILPCQHIYHKVCVIEWLKRNSTCPLCKQFVAPVTTRPSPPALPTPYSVTYAPASRRSPRGGTATVVPITFSDPPTTAHTTPDSTTLSRTLPPPSTTTLHINTNGAASASTTSMPPSPMPYDSSPPTNPRRWQEDEA